MKKVLQLISFLVIVEFANAQTFDWAFKLGIRYSGGFISETVNDNGGNLLVTGALDLSYDFDPGPGIFNLTSNGNTDIFIAKYTAQGNFINAINLGSNASDFGCNIKVDQSNNIVVTGYYAGTVDFDPGPGDFFLSTHPIYTTAFILKLDSNFNFIWAKSLDPLISGNYNFHSTNPTMVDNNDNIIITGGFLGTVDFDPGLSTYYLTADDVSQFILKLDSAGNFLWAKIISASGNNPFPFITAYNLIVDNEKNIYTVGQFRDTADFDPDAGMYYLYITPNSESYSCDIFISKYDSSGNFIWAKSFGGMHVEFCESVALYNNESLILVGSFVDTIDFDPGAGTYLLQVDTAFNPHDSYVLKLDTAGNFAWADQFKTKPSGLMTPYGNHAMYVLTNSSGNIILGGGFSGDSVDFDPGPATYYITPSSATSAESYIAILDDTGNFIGVNKIGNINSSISIEGGGKGSYGNFLFTGSFRGLVDFDFGSNTYFMQFDSSCCNNNFVLSINDISTIILENIFSQSSISIFPNPATDYITIQYNLTSAKETTVEVFNIYGQVVKPLTPKGGLQNTGKQEIKIDIKELPAGIYFVKMKVDGKEEVRKVVKY